MTFPIREVGAGLRFPEGPVAFDDGSVLVCEIAGGTIARVADERVEEFARVGGGPNGAAIGPDGRLYIANNGGVVAHVEDGLTRLVSGVVPDDYTGGYIQALDLRTGAVETVATECGGEPLSAPNDLVFDEHGGLYFTDSGKVNGRHRVRGGLYYLTVPDPAVRCVVWPLEVPNGVGLSPDGTRLYVSETTTGRLWYWDLERPGVVRPGHSPRGFSQGSSGTLLHGFGGYTLLDSLAVDAAGNVCVATLVRGVISVVSADGQVEESVRLPEHDPLVTNICFGGPDLRSAFVTCGGLGKLLEVRWPWRGLRLHFQA